MEKRTRKFAIHSPGAAIALAAIALTAFAIANADVPCSAACWARSLPFAIGTWPMFRDVCAVCYGFPLVP